MFQIEVSNISVIINTIIRVTTAMIFIFFLIPLFIKEAKVRNGLRILRYELLFTGSIIFFINTVGLVIIIFRFKGIDTRLITDVVTYINTFGFLAYALVKYRIYTQKYSAESKKFHEKMERMESKEMQRIEDRKKKQKAKK